MKVYLGLVHNNSAHVGDVKNEIETLKLVLQKDGKDVEIGYSSYQPEIHNHSVFRFLKRRFEYFKLMLKWNAHKESGGQFRFFISSFLWFLRVVDLKKLTRHSIIETFVTDKHLRLWFSAIEDSDYIVIFEDDVIFKKESISNLEKVINFAEASENKILYFDLAGGLDIKALGISGLKVFDNISDELSSIGAVHYEKIVTNTACGYMLSKGLLKEFLAILIENPSYRDTSIDWLMNRLSIEMKNHQRESFHFNPPIFNHGSFTGEYQSWQDK
ncbi:glycosyltransferase family 25 protein [Marinomonas rhizomae]|uniref:glycosyltransferase family 25 protein n=1 Tax=Marinomonas rhizomae TaxID=491948 RepID=UPI0021083A31|nr:glycosyltransferase family 25 protein [Marinomonas rhizomae]UTW00181.1 glycosyltransferase family 25 protein [Marinomonas rhizomae]